MPNKTYIAIDLKSFCLYGILEGGNRKAVGMDAE